MRPGSPWNCPPDGGDRPRALTDGGAPPSLEALYRRHAADVWRWAARLLGGSGDPDDVVHDVFLVVRRRLGAFRGDSRITTWLHGITLRTALAHRRRHRRWQWLRSGEARSVAWLADFSAAPADGADPHTALERRRDTEAVYSLLEKIDDKYRTVLILRDLEAIPVEEIAQLTGVTVSNVWARLSRGRKKFHQLYQQRRRRQPP
jgi:RNA polymerase sigma-70 factor (ECF subfamily)